MPHVQGCVPYFLFVKQGWARKLPYVNYIDFTIFFHIFYHKIPNYCDLLYEICIYLA